MKVIILAGGMPSVLADDVEKIPKPMAEIGGRPILWHIMKHYAFYGYNDFIICTGIKGSMIKEYFMDYYVYQSDITVDLKNNQIEIHRKQTEDWKVTIVDTGIHASITQRIHRIREYLDGDMFMLSYGDCVSDINIAKMHEFHLRHGKIGTMAVARPTGRNTILPVTQGEGNGTAGIEKVDAWVNACNMMFHTKVFQCIEEDESYFEERNFSSLLRRKELIAYRHNGFWSPMETKRDHSILERMWKEGKAPWKVWKE